MQIIEMFKARKINILIFLAIFLTLNSLNIYVLKYFPTSTEFACQIGADLNLVNILFGSLFSLILSIVLIGLKETLVIGAKFDALTSSTTLLSALLVTFSTICTICLLPAISLLGVSIGLSAFSIFSIQIKILALILLLGSLILIELKLRRICIFNNCEIYD